MKTDAVVIGSGPAGALAALLLAREGVRTLLVERAVFPRHKVCGCCLAPGGQSVLARSGASGVLDGAPAVRTLALRHQSGRVDARTPAYRVIDRATMDTRLVELATQAGCVTRFGVGARVTDDGVDVDGDIVRAGVVLCADGLAGSSLRGREGFGWDVRPASRIGVGCVVDAVEGDEPDAITMCVGHDGYCGVARLADGRAVVAAALTTSSVRGGGGGAGDAMERLMSENGVHARLERRGMRSAPTLTRRRTGVEERGRVFVVGDASGYVEPFTGEGMSWALRAGEMVRDHALRALEGTYERGAWASAVGGERGRATLGCRAVTAVLRRPALTGVCARAARLAPGLASAVARRVVAA
ncbi:MAG: FAD-dependent monooxygenase [Planctomycetota bacterium]